MKGPSQHGWFCVVTADRVLRITRVSLLLAATMNLKAVLWNIHLFLVFKLYLDFHKCLAVTHSLLFFFFFLLGMAAHTFNPNMQRQRLAD